MQFWHELKDRKLVQWALAYAAFGIAVLEILNAIETPFALPSSLVRAIMVVVAAGFGITLVLAWFHGERGHQRLTIVEVALLLVIIAVGAAGATIAWGPRRPPPSAAQGWKAPAAPAPERNSIAVLPFENLSGDPRDDYFSDGITEELTNSLGELPGLRVASRTSAFQFKARRADVREVGGKLGVAAVLEGSIQRSGSRVRITARLVDTSNGYQLWTDRIDADASDVFAAEDKISKAVAGALQVRLALARQPTENARPTNADAHQSYLKGRYYVRQSNPDTVRMAERQFREAVKSDPGFAPAWAGLGESFLAKGRLGLLPQQVARDSARIAAMKAMRLDSTLSQVHVILSHVADRIDQRVQELQKAVQLNPNSAEARSALADMLATQGKRDAALREARTAAKLDPLGRGNRGFTRVVVLSGEDEQGQNAPPAPPAPPNVPGVHVPGIPRPGQMEAELCAEYALDEIMSRPAGSLCEKGRRLGAKDPGVLASVALGFARLDRRGEAMDALQAYEALVPDDARRAVTSAAVYAALGENDTAFASLDRVDRARLRPLLGDPRLAPLHRDTRFTELLRRGG